MKQEYTLNLARLHEAAKTDLAGLVSLFKVDGTWELMAIDSRTLDLTNYNGHDIVMIFGDRSVLIIHCINQRTASVEFMAATAEFQKCAELGIYQLMQ